MDEPRLAQTRLTNEHHDLTGTGLGPLPSVLEKGDLDIAPGQRRQSGRPEGLDRVAGLTDALNAKDVDRLRQSPDPALSGAHAVETASDQPMGGSAAEDLSGDCDLRESQGHVSRFADQRDRAGLPADHGRPRVQTDPRP